CKPSGIPLLSRPLRFSPKIQLSPFRLYTCAHLVPGVFPSSLFFRAFRTLEAKNTPEWHTSSRNSRKKRPERWSLRSSVKCKCRKTYFLQDSLTIERLVTFRWPCSLESASTVSLAFSLAPCMSGCQTLPDKVTVCPRCGESLTVALVTSHVLPSSPVTLNSLALSPFDRQPVMLRTSSLLSWLGAACAAKIGERTSPD